jgi:hypothetical protein
MSEQTRTLRLCSAGLFLDLQGGIHYINLHVVLMITRNRGAALVKALKEFSEHRWAGPGKTKKVPHAAITQDEIYKFKDSFEKGVSFEKGNYLVEISRAAMIQAMMWPVHALLECRQTPMLHRPLP